MARRRIGGYRHRAADPGPGARWLDVTYRPGSTPIRINLDAPATPAQFTELPRTAERCLDSASEQVLRVRGQDLGCFKDLMEVLTALRAVKAIGPTDPALRRLVSLVRRQGGRLPADLAEVADTDLPPPWLSVLDHAGAQDGPDGFAPVTAVLPELDGTRLAIAGLISGPTSANLRVLSWGSGEFTWWARDSAGRWHFVTSSDSFVQAGYTGYDLELSPALDPTATAMDLILSGRSGSVTVTVPLDWVR
jgi:hypothetical protein